MAITDFHHYKQFEDELYDNITITHIHGFCMYENTYFDSIFNLRELRNQSERHPINLELKYLQINEIDNSRIRG